MAMGITQALKLQEGPINALAQLPQQQLMAMAQQGRIPADVLPIILNEKAQMAQQAANMQAMQQPMPPSVVEQAMAINAQAEASPPQMQAQPQMMAMAPQQEMPPMDAGVASLPVPDAMYASADEGYAGGGIVAFDKGGDVPGFFAGELIDFNDLPLAPRNLRSSGTGKDSFAYESAIPSLSTTEYRIDPVTGEPVTFGEYSRRLDARRAKAGVPPSSKSSKSSSGTAVPINELSDAQKAGPITGLDSLETLRSKAAASIAGMSPKNRALYDENISGIKRIAEAAAPKAKKSSAPIVPAAVAPAATEANKPETAPKNAEKPEISFAEFKGKYGLDVEDPAMADVRAKIASMAGESNLARQDARNMALLQAGLGMMAGTSPYALANIGAGGMKGAEAYAASLKDIKAAEKDLFKMQTELAKADQARSDGNIKSFMEHQEKAKKHELDVRKVVTDENLTAAQIAKLETDKQYLKGQLRKMGADERLIDAQINNLNKPDEVQRIINAYKNDPAAFKEAFAIYRPSSASGQNETKVRQDAEAYVNNPMLLTQDPKLRELVKKAKDTNSPNDLKALETYRDQLRTNYINRILSKQPGVAGGAGSVDANNPLLKGN